MGQNRGHESEFGLGPGHLGLALIVDPQPKNHIEASPHLPPKVPLVYSVRPFQAFSPSNAPLNPRQEGRNCQRRKSHV